MQVLVHTPEGVLGEFIEGITFYANYSPGHTIDRLLPDAGVHLIINLDNQPRFIYYNDTLLR